MLEGMRAAYVAVLQRFDPKRIEDRLPIATVLIEGFLAVLHHGATGITTVRSMPGSHTIRCDLFELFGERLSGLR